MAIATLLASLNSCTNPWIYLAFSGPLCKRKRRITKKWTSTGNTYMSETENMRLRTYSSDKRNGRLENHHRLIDDV